MGHILLEVCVSEGKRRQALNPCGHISWENTTLLKSEKADLAWAMLPFIELIKKILKSIGYIQMLVKEIPVLDSSIFP